MQKLSTLILCLYLCLAFAADPKTCEVVLPDPIAPGSQSNATLNTTQRIVNGRNALSGTASYLVSFHEKPDGQAFCSGSLISERWVLTAAHCNVSSANFVRLGGANASEGELRNISKVVNHEDYGKEAIVVLEIVDDDIAIVQLATAAPSDMKFMLINSNKDVPDAPHWARVSGYGVTNPGNDDGGILRSVDIPSKSSARCSALYAGKGLPVGLMIKDQKQFCAGYKDGHCGSCFGDSGGPLYVFDNKRNPVQIGITSFGVPSKESCAPNQRPAVYVRVSNYVDWLKRNGAIFKTSNDGQNHKGPKGLEDESFLDKIDPVCFPSDAQVTLRGGANKTMDELAIGDEVLTSMGEYSPVFMFTHKLARGAYPFMTLEHGTGSITLSAGHYIFLNGQLLPAERARIGDELELGSGNRTRILRTQSVVKRGLYNPQTATGTIVVNGVKASAYTTTVTPMVAHSLVRPLSIMYKFLGLDVSQGFFHELMQGASSNKLDSL